MSWVIRLESPCVWKLCFNSATIYKYFRVSTFANSIKNQCSKMIVRRIFCNKVSRSSFILRSWFNKCSEFLHCCHTICLRSGNLLIQPSIDPTLSYYQEHNLQAQVNWTGRGRVSTPGSSLFRRGTTQIWETSECTQIVSKYVGWAESWQTLAMQC